MIKDYIDSRFDISYLKNFDFITALGFCVENISCDICVNPLLYDIQTKLYIRYEAGTEEGVSALFLYNFCDCIELQGYIKALDYGYLTSETNIDEEEMEELKKSFISHENPLLLIGSNFYIHNRSRNILNIFSVLSKCINIAFLSLDAKYIYTIKSQICALEHIYDLPENNGCMIYVDFLLSDRPVLRFSKEFAKVWQINNDSLLEIVFDSFKIKTQAFLDSDLSGVIAILRLDKEINCGYRYKQVLINKIN